MQTCAATLGEREPPKQLETTLTDGSNRVLRARKTSIVCKNQQSIRVIDLIT